MIYPLINVRESVYEARSTNVFSRGFYKTKKI
jgi:hypothetical protein